MGKGRHRPDESELGDGSDLLYRFTAPFHQLSCIGADPEGGAGAPTPTLGFLKKKQIKDISVRRREIIL